MKELKNLNSKILEKNQIIMKLKNFNVKLNEEKKQSIIDLEKRSSQYSNSNKKGSVFKEQNNLSRELLEKICNLENSNKKINKKNVFLMNELDDIEMHYKSKIELLYTLLKNYTSHTFYN